MLEQSEALSASWAAETYGIALLCHPGTSVGVYEPFSESRMPCVNGLRIPINCQLTDRYSASTYKPDYPHRSSHIMTETEYCGLVGRESGVPRRTV